MESGQYNLSDRICEPQISDFSKKRINLGLSKTPPPRLALHPFDEPPVVPPGDEAWKRLGHPEVFHVPKIPEGGSLLQPLLMMMDHENFFRCIYITPTKVIKQSKFGQKLYVICSSPPLSLVIRALLTTTGRIGMVILVELRFRAQDQELLARR